MKLMSKDVLYKDMMKYVCLFLSIVLAFGIVFPATASNCTSGQQCSSCEDYIGHCTTGCFRGFYGPQCKLRCSQGCKDNLCVTNEDGIEKCCAGCKIGFYGTRCSIHVPCIQDEGCQKCPRKCEDGFCQLDLRCVSGCEDSYYGTNCTSCGPDCEVCDRRTGTCLEDTSSKPTDEPCTPRSNEPNCSLKCSPGCRNGSCRIDDDGTFPCTDGCKPGWYGSLCKIPCEPPGGPCRECPRKCDDGFCQLDSRCVSGCVDSYYGTGCFTCGPDCQVCNRYTDRCYNCTDGCPFSSCHVPDQCPDRWQTTVYSTVVHTTGNDTGGEVKNAKMRIFYLFLLIAGSGISVLVIVSLMIFLKLLLKRRRQRARIQLAQTVSPGGTEGYTALRRSAVGNYIHAVNDPYDEVYEEDTF